MSVQRVVGSCLAIVAALIFNDCGSRAVSSRQSPSAAPFVSPQFQATQRAGTAHRTERQTPAAVPAPSSSVPTGPAIYSVSATPKVAQAGDTIVWDVRTSPDVMS